MLLWAEFLKFFVCLTVYSFLGFCIEPSLVSFFPSCFILFNNTFASGRDDVFWKKYSLLCRMLFLTHADDTMKSDMHFHFVLYATTFLSVSSVRLISRSVIVRISTERPSIYALDPVLFQSIPAGFILFSASVSSVFLTDFLLYRALVPGLLQRLCFVLRRVPLVSDWLSFVPRTSPRPSPAALFCFALRFRLFSD